VEGERGGVRGRCGEPLNKRILRSSLGKKKRKTHTINSEKQTSASPERKTPALWSRKTPSFREKKRLPNGKTESQQNERKEEKGCLTIILRGRGGAEIKEEHGEQGVERKTGNSRARRRDSRT